LSYKDEPVVIISWA